MWKGPRREPGRRSAATLPERRAGLAARASNERDASRAQQHVAQAGQPQLCVAPGGQRLGHRHGNETRLVVRLHLADQVEVGADHRADGRVAAAGHGIAMQDDRLEAGGHLDRADRITGVDDVRRIGAGAERLLARPEAERAALLVAIADAVGLGGDGPAVLEECPGRFVGKPVVIEARQHAQRHLARQRRAQALGQRGAFARRPAIAADGELVALLQAPPLVAAERPQRIGRAAAEHHRHVDAAGHGQAGARAALHVFEAQRAARLDAQCHVAGLDHAVDLRLHLGAGHGDQRLGMEQQLRAEQGAFERRGAFVVADQQVGRAQRVLVERAGRRDADAVITGPAGILHRGGESGLDDLDGGAGVSRHGAPRPMNGCTRPDRAGRIRARSSPRARAEKSCPLPRRPRPRRRRRGRSA